MSLIVGIGTASADKLTIEKVTIPKGGEGTITINYQFDAAEQYSGWQFSLHLPEQLATVKNSKGNSLFTAGTCHDESYTISSTYSDGLDNYVALSMESTPITGTEGVLLTIPVVAVGENEVGSSYQASLTTIQFGNKDGVHTAFFNDVYFDIVIGEAEDIRIVLDENATSIIESATQVDVRVLRTIKANEWSTICLPFAMTEAQVKTAFGDDVQLGNFTGYETVEENGDIAGITVNFNAVTTLSANHPYIIKVSEAISEFSVDQVDIDPKDEPMINYGTKRKPKAIVGTYVANTIVENGCLFLSDNKFWYSVGSTKMKAFRAYFDFIDLLPDFENNYAESRVSIMFNDETPTGIGLSTISHSEGAVYDLQGRKVVSPKAKGLYIVNGKKVSK
ncbi:MAG: hypothetical protein J6E29_01595 [Prevotella sp.]|nr:hypothetical protein [Prevotella sp.]